MQRLMMILAVLLLADGCGGGPELAGDWSRTTDANCVANTEQEAVEAALAGFIKNAFSTAERLTIQQDGEALVFDIEEYNVAYDAILEDDGTVLFNSPCWEAGAVAGAVYNQGCLTRTGRVLAGGNVIEITELYELGGPGLEFGAHTLTCVHKWERAGA